MHLLSSSISLCVFLLVLIIGADCQSNCPPQGQLVNPKPRHFYHHIKSTTLYQQWPISIAQPPHFTQRLVGELLRHTLTTKLDYVNISISEVNELVEKNELVSNCTIDVSFYPPLSESDRNPNLDIDDFQIFTNNKSETCVVLDWPPEHLMRLETSTTTSFAGSEFTRLGATGFSSRFGIYATAGVIGEDGYTSLTEESVVSKFSSSDGILLASSLSKQSSMSESEDGESHDDSLCQRGIDHCTLNVYTPPICQDDTQCAVIFIGHLGDFTDDLIHRIQVLQLRLKVAYIGNQLTSFVLNQTLSGHPVLFFTLSPDILTSSTNFSRVRFLENCSKGQVSCDFPSLTTWKSIWVPLSNSEQLIHQAFQNLHITGYDIKVLLREYANIYGGDTSAQSLAKFVRQSSIAQNLISDWLPKQLNEKPTLYIGGYFPLWTYGDWRQVNLLPAAHMAVDKVNCDPTTLDEFQLKLIESDTGCDSSWVLNVFTKYLQNNTIWNNMVGGLGPACSDTALSVAGLAKHYRYIFVSYSVDAMVLTLDRQRYPYFFRTIPQIREYADVYVRILKDLDLDRLKVSTITDESSNEFAVFHHLMAEVFRKKGIDLVLKELLPRDIYQKDKYAEGVGQYLDKIKDLNSKVIILDVYKPVAMAFMCEASHKKMTSADGYIWFLPSNLDWDWYDTRHNEDSNNLACHSEAMEHAVKGYFSLTHSNIDSSDAVAVGDMTGSQFEDIYERLVSEEDSGNMDSNAQKYKSEFGSYTYDAVWTFAKAVDALYKDNPAYLKFLHTPYAADQYTEKIYNTSFQGVSGEIKFNRNGDRSGIITFNQYYGIGRYGFFEPTEVGTGTPDDFKIHIERIEWLEKPDNPEDPPPPGEKECPWESLKSALGTECVSALVMITVIPCILLLTFGVVVATLYVRKVKLKYRKKRELVDRMNNRTMLNFDEKEIPRDNIVINRKLGEGAYGTVYGGEGFINSTWIGVAVKTLKVGSNSESKLDFLREADIMKRFDHKNIIKLLGVTTVGEPAYAIMEFMLFGDLKTYLLSRRELVGTNTKEAEDVSASSLTRMAIDIAEGIHYLHSREYVHRDIACRNCLVSANRTVKIGDFGMTRRVYDQGYYVFTGRGKLPVRWMAPESLDRGVFTYKTDIWSYGILLYELITFGSIPYQLLSDAEVFELVKSGHTLQLPEECTDELKSLVLGCWRPDPEKRVCTADIYTILHSNENMIQPLLASPTYSKIREEGESAEMDMSPAPLKSSSLWKKPLLKQSSSVISVDTGTNRHSTEIAYKRSNSKRKSSHSIIDLGSNAQPCSVIPSPTQMSMPSPSHSAGPPSGAAFQFSLESNRQIFDDIFSESKPITTERSGQRCHHYSGEGANNHQQAIGCNHYLLTTRSCTDIDGKSQSSHTPLLISEETST